jgi:hypothetical protein
MNLQIPSYFGKPPFATEYAATNKHEDWAESIALEVQGKRIGGRKGRFIRGILRQLPK